MAITTTRRQFDCDTSEACKAANEIPVFITEQDHPTHVLLSIEDYQRLCAKVQSLAKALAERGLPDTAIAPPPVARVLGAFHGKISIDPSFDDPLPDDELSGWN